MDNEENSCLNPHYGNCSGGNVCCKYCNNKGYCDGLCEYIEETDCEYIYKDIVGDTMKKTVKEIADIYGVTTSGVRYWLINGLPYDTERVIGIKPRKVIDTVDVDNFLKLTKRR